MSFFKPTYHSKLFRDFKGIEPNDYREIIRFFEDKENEIRRLDFEEYFELLVAYVDSLFEIGAYGKHLLMVDLVIEQAIDHNLRRPGEADLFQRMLFKKAASLYNTLELDKADYILRELVRIDPNDRLSVLFLKKCLRRQRPKLISNTRATAIFLFLLCAFVICLEVLIVRPFYSMHTGLIETSRNSIFILGVGFLIGGDLLHRWLVDREINRFVAGVRRQKQVP